jgi:hypothetical protein
MCIRAALLIKRVVIKETAGYPYCFKTHRMV